MAEDSGTHAAFEGVTAVGADADALQGTPGSSKVVILPKAGNHGRG